MDFDADVVVAGGGPTGMIIAGDLARLGRSVVVLERWPTLNPASRAFATMARTLELLDARGLAAGLLSRSATTGQVNLFGGARLTLGQLRSRYRFVMIAPQTEVDQALARYAAEQGADVRRGIELTGLTQDDGGVTVTARPKDGGEPFTLRARYLVGADGHHSTVRALAGQDFPGRSVLSSLVLADVRLTAGPRVPGLTLASTPSSFAFLVPYGRKDAGGEWFRSMTWDRGHQVPDTEPVRPGEVAAVLNRTMGRDLGVAEISWHSRFHCEERQARQYRIGRVFLAGDAAHVHSPMGGQGMNTGIQDGANLAWKLDAVLRGADDALLGSYQAERHPIGQQVIAVSGALMRGVTLGPRPARFLRDRLAPLAVRIPLVRNRIAGMLAGTELRYPHRRGESPLVGTRATEIPLDGGPLTQIQFRRPGFVLVVARSDELPGGLPVAVTRRQDDGSAVLVRPDGYIAWAGALGGRGWEAVLRRWQPDLVTRA